ncbi:MAG: deaminase [Proteobacteria bacterium]|jgi:dCMP deaminase|nr:deaminase [Pseudomonadota bacterium]
MKKRTPPREVPTRDERYMGLAFCIAQLFSKDPHTQVASVIVGDENRPKGWGYNGPPQSIADDEVDWSRPEKYDMIVHSEINAINHSFGSLKEATIYITAPPCPRCMLEIIAAGIDKIIYFNFRADAGSSVNAEALAKIEEIAKKAGIQLTEFSGNLNCVKDAVADMDRIGIF